jgi:hypothetical protein
VKGLGALAAPGLLGAGECIVVVVGKKVIRDRALDISQTPTRWVLFPFLDIEPTVF